VYFEERGGFSATPVYDRNRLRPGNRIAGPAVVEERITTVIAHPGWNLRVDEYENIVMVRVA
jgi:N-methylhydantoinase A/oxoprolinase/acetone carboxylase beta subunit